MILNALEGKSLPIYGDGKNVRDWLYVEDHCSAIWKILKEGKIGETYNIGGECEQKNIDIVKKICMRLEERMPSKKNLKLKGKRYIDLIKFIKDRPGHDRRYAINCDKIKKELKWKPAYNFESGLEYTIDWYIKNEEWIKNIKTGKYKKWISENYSKR
jgi:dTDP-glucose 4,6-dehydratase